ncbi:MAG: hypothetical protein WC096_02720 [Sphaerochaetaceae bacterium]|nr:hypothetical protein [Proteiniphilum sp.]MDD4453468.1 hypothetical protein [Proteiniphilum sp.]
MTTCPNASAPTGQEVRWYTGTARCEQITITSGDVTATGFSLTGLAEYGPIEAYKLGELLTIGQCNGTAATPATEATGCDFITYTGITEADVITVYYIDVDTGSELVAIANAQDVNTSISADSDSQAVAGEGRKKQSVGAADQTMTVNQLFVTEAFYREICGASYADAKIATGTMNVNTSHKTVFNKIDAIVAKRLDSSGRIQRKWAMFDVQATGITQNQPVSAGQANISGTFNVGYQINTEWSYST